MAEHFRIPGHILDAIEAHRQACRDPMAAFFYDLPALAAQGSAMKAALPSGVELYYAIKANSEAAIIDTLAPWWMGSSCRPVARSSVPAPVRRRAPGCSPDRASSTPTCVRP